MLRGRDLVKYRRKLRYDVGKVNDAITKGAFLSKEEWFDFLFKSFYVDYYSKNMLKYWLFNRDTYKFASACAKVFGYLVNISVKGFVNDTYVSDVKKLTKRLCKCTSRVNPVEVDSFDRNGTLYLSVVFKGGIDRTYGIRNKKDAINCILTITRYCSEIADCTSDNVEFGNFLNGYISREFKKLISGVEPTPYCSSDDRLTLAQVLNHRSKLRMVGSEHTEERLISIV